MSSDYPKPKPGRKAPAAGDPERGDASPVAGNVTGRVTFDDRGNAVWEWAVRTGKFGTDISTSRLKKLDNAGLSILDDAPPPDRLVKENSRKVERGYSPYDSGLPGRTDPGRKEPPRRKDLKKLGEWFKLKKQVEANKRGDK